MFRNLLSLALQAVLRKKRSSVLLFLLLLAVSLLSKHGLRHSALPK